MLREAPFTGNLIEFDDIHARNGFARAVMQLVRAGELPPDTRVAPLRGCFLLTTLDSAQVGDVAESVRDAQLTLGAPGTETLPEKQRKKAERPEKQPRIAPEKVAHVIQRLMDGVKPNIVAKETELPYQAVYYYVAKARAMRGLRRMAEAGD